jgi:hypothetical protein
LADKPQHDADLARRAIEKQLRGAPVSRRERGALNRVQADQRARLIDEIVQAFPPVVYRRLTGLRTQQLHRLADQYGVPLRGTAFDLAAILRFFHALLDKYGGRLLDDDGLLSGPGSVALELCRREKYELLKIERQRQERGVIPIELFNAGLREITSAIRIACEALQRHHGEVAADVLREAVDGASERIVDMFGRQQLNAAEDHAYSR